MNSQTIVMCVVALILGMLLAHMLKNVCGCNKVVEGTGDYCGDPQNCPNDWVTCVNDTVRPCHLYIKPKPPGATKAERAKATGCRSSYTYIDKYSDHWDRTCTGGY